MAAFALALLALMAVGADARISRKAVASFAIGGATSANSIVSAMITGKGACAAAAKGQVYQSVGSGDGIKAFNNGTYASGFSDTPMNAAQDATGVSLTPGKYTMPVMLARYSFFITGQPDGVFKLTAQASYNLFKFGATKSPDATKVTTPVSRSESSGTTFVIKRYWNKVPVAGIAADIKADPTFYGTAPFPATWAAAKNMAPGSKDVCTKVAGIPKGITYAQVGVCNSVAAGKTGEVLLLNKAGNWVKSSNSDASQSVPRTLPAATASWNSIPDDMILATGAQTAPIVSFIYTFIRKSGLAAGAGPKGTIAKNILVCINGNVNKYATTYQFDTSPPGILTANLKLLNALT